MRIRWNRLFTDVKTSVESQADGVTRLRVDGMVCDEVCARRAGDALAAMPGVDSVDVDFDAGTATVRGAAHEAADYDRAVRGVVAGKPARRLLDVVGHAFRRSARRDDRHVSMEDR